MKHVALCGLLLLAACASSATPTAEQQARIQEARALLAAADLDGALAITDKLIAEQPDWREARVLAAEASMQLTRVDRKGLRKDLLLEDVVRNLEAVVKADPADAACWTQLAEAEYELMRFLDCVNSAGQAVSSLNEKAKEARTAADADLMARAQLAAAKARVQLFVEVRNEELASGKPDTNGIVRPSEQALRLAQEALAALQPVCASTPVEGFKLSSQVHQWLGANDLALADLERGVRQAPDAADLHVALQDFYRSIGRIRELNGLYSSLVRESSAPPVMRWFQGRAQVMAADDLRAKGDFQGAIEAYRKALATYGEYQAMVPSHAEACGQWRAICELSIARTLVDAGDLEGARTHLFLADEASPMAVAYDGMTPSLVDSFGSHYATVVFVISRSLSESSGNSLEKVLAFNEAVLQRHPQKWGFVYNNAALPARDLGVQVVREAEQGGKSEDERKQAQARAMELWERSYRYYEEAVKLSPEDARIINDAGLMLIYHLDRDFDRAKELFERAIAVGQPQLDAMPADADRDERNNLEEAIGDAWQNLAVLAARHHNKPFAEYRAFCEKAVQYYPYRQREAARMLRANEKESSAPADDNAAPQQGKGGPRWDGWMDTDFLQDPADPKFAKLKTEVETRAKDGDLDGALSALDASAKEFANHAPFHALRGDVNLQYARKARDAGRKGVEFLFADAVAALKKAVELDSEPVAPRLMLAEPLYDSGEVADAAKACTALLTHMQSQGGGKPDELRAVHLLRAQAASRAFIAAKSERKEAPDLLQDTRNSMRYLEQEKALTAELRKTWMTTEQWAGATVEAVNIQARAVKADPADGDAVAALVDAAAAAGQSKLAVDALADRTDPFSLWYLGRAHYAQSLELRNESKNEDAMAAIDRAMSAFEKSMAGNRDFTDSCQQWLAMCLGKKGNLAFWMEKLDDAEKWLVESTRLRPDRINEDLGLQETTKLGILRVADKFYRAQDLARVERIYRATSDAANADLDLLNNSGLFSRDWGNVLERDGKKDLAMDMYEQSYKAYSRANQLDPGNVRLRNDRALILIYHLEREWDTAKELVDSAIVDGEKQMKENPPAEPQDKQNLAEAIGDCYENLALWHLKHSGDLAAAKAAAEASRNYYPGQRRPGAMRHLRTVEERQKQGK